MWLSSNSKSFRSLNPAGKKQTRERGHGELRRTEDVHREGTNLGEQSNRFDAEKNFPQEICVEGAQNEIGSGGKPNERFSMVEGTRFFPPVIFACVVGCT